MSDGAFLSKLHKCFGEIAVYLTQYIKTMFKIMEIVNIFLLCSDLYFLLYSDPSQNHRSEHRLDHYKKTSKI